VAKVLVAAKHSQIVLGFCLTHSFIEILLIEARCQWLKPVLLVTQEAEIRRIKV
jgi:hypothetical protein